MAIGPVEYVLIAFPENRFRGDIAPELAKLIDSGTVRILDLLFIGKDAEGDVAIFEFDQLDELGAFSTLEGETGGVISEEDIDYAASVLEPNSSAALIVWEDTWATPFVEAVREAGGVLVEGARIPHELIEAAVASWS